MSLRLRLTILSTISMSAVFAIFGALAFFMVQSFFYNSVDQNLRQQVAANNAWMSLRDPGNGGIPELGSNDTVSSVFFMLFDTEGKIRGLDRQIPYSDAQFTRALDGETVYDTSVLTDGGRVRLLMQPYYFEGRVVAVLLAATPLQVVDQLLRELQTLLFVAGLILLVVAAGGSYLLTGRALREVEKVTRKARQIALSGDLRQRIMEPTTEDEVGNLARTFNQMLQRLEAGFDAQRRFVADSSHELRTPLTVISSNLHLLKRTTDPDERRELFNVTEAEVARLKRMVNDLLYMAQVQAGHKVAPALRAVELDSLLLEVFARARAMAATKGQTVVLAHEDIAVALGDSDQLQHLLLNLVDNAVKYSPPGATVKLGLWREEDTARIEVTDAGPGIAPEDLAQIFERFYRTRDARNSERAGSGLGLAIVKSIADAHGAQLQVESAIGRGTSFTLRLPLYRPTGVTEPGVSASVQPEIREDKQLITRVARGGSRG